MAVSDSFTVTDYYLDAVGALMLRDGRVFVTGGTTSVDITYNFNPVKKTLVLSDLKTSEPQRVLTISGTASEGISLTIRGKVGQTYGIEFLPEFGAAIQWKTLTTLTLTNADQSWSDAVAATERSRFYRVLLPQQRRQQRPPLERNGGMAILLGLGCRRLRLDL